MSYSAFGKKRTGQEALGRRKCGQIYEAAEKYSVYMGYKYGRSADVVAKDIKRHYVRAVENPTYRKELLDKAAKIK